MPSRGQLLQPEDRMLARRLALTYCIEALIYSLLWAWWLPQWSVAMLFGCVVISALVLRLMYVCLSFLMALTSTEPQSPVHHIAHDAWRSACRIGPGTIVSLVVCELGAVLWTFWVLQPFESLLRPTEKPAQAPSVVVPILLIHGYMCNGACWWALRRYLKRRGFASIFTINLEPFDADIDDFAGQVADRVAAIRDLTGARRILLVCHSMGGLVARAYLIHQPDPDAVVKVVTLGTPHHGTVLARFGRGVDARQMRRRSPWLEQLNTSAGSGVPITSIYTLHDNIVVPPDSAHLPRARNIALVGISHLHLLYSKRVWDLIVDEITL